MIVMDALALLKDFVLLLDRQISTLTKRLEEKTGETEEEALLWKVEFFSSKKDLFYLNKRGQEVIHILTQRLIDINLNKLEELEKQIKKNKQRKRKKRKNNRIE